MYTVDYYYRNGIVQQVNSIRRGLVDKWLPSTSKNSQEEFDVTMNAADLDDQSRIVNTSDADNDLSLSRVMYILTNGPLDTSIQRLLSVAFGTDEQETVSHETRVRALRVAYSITGSIAELEKLSGMSAEQIRESLEYFTYLGALNQLRSPVSVVTVR